MNIPLPTNIIPYWFFPWNNASWPGYTPFIYHKEILIIDAIRQIFPWKVLAFNLLHQGNWPLWNPYNFAGQPLLANFQTSVFYPMSWGFLFLSPVIAWSIYILVQPLILFLTSWLFFRRLFNSPIPALASSLGLTFTAYFSTHYFFGVSTHPLIWLPLSLYLTELWAAKKLSILKFLLFQVITFVLIILGGYPQASVFSLGLAIFYFLWRCASHGLIYFLLAGVLATGVCAIQLLPTFELYRLSPREGKESLAAVNNSFAEAKHLVMIISPDFYGSPATNNYFGGWDYSGVNGYFGITLLPLALYSLRRWRSSELKFWQGAVIFGLTMAFANPISRLPSQLGIPILGSGAPWYYLLFFQIGMIVLSGYGLLDLLKVKSRDKKFLLTMIVVAAIISFVLLGGYSSAISLNNTLKTTLLFVAFAAGYIVFPKKVGWWAILTTLVFGLYFWQRIMPFGQIKYFYPSHPLVQFLQAHAGIDRFYGPENARLPSNLGAYFQIQQPEGYDSLWPKRYGQIVAAAANGKFPLTINRAEVLVPQEDNFFRDRLLRLLGVKYYLDKSDNPEGDNGANNLKYSPRRFTLVGQWGPASVYRDETTFPRVFLAQNYILASGDDVLKRVYDPKVNLRDTVVLEKDPGVSGLTSGSAEIINYRTNEVDLKTNSAGPSILFLSDNFFPGWQAFVNGRKAEILRADYSFRAVAVPPGESTVSFKYQPESFSTGLKISLLSLIVLCLLFPLSLKKIKPS